MVGVTASDPPSSVPSKPAVLGLVALLGLLAGLALMALAGLAGRSDLAVLDRPLRGNGALLVPMVGAPTVLATGWSALAMGLRPGRHRVAGRERMPTSLVAALAGLVALLLGLILAHAPILDRPPRARCSTAGSSRGLGDRRAECAPGSPGAPRGRCPRPGPARRTGELPPRAPPGRWPPARGRWAVGTDRRSRLVRGLAGHGLCPARRRPRRRAHRRGRRPGSIGLAAHLALSSVERGEGAGSVSTAAAVG